MTAVRVSTAKSRRRKVSALANALTGAMVGVVVGLAVAVGVALYMNGASTPFVDKVKRPLEVPKADEVPDPNRSLIRARPASPPLPAPPEAAPTSDVNAVAATNAPAVTSGATDVAAFVLQVGAFRGQEDADAMKVKLALLGIEAFIASAEVNDTTFYRVRVGPYASLDQMTAARNRLAESGIEASVVRQR